MLTAPCSVANDLLFREFSSWSGPIPAGFGADFVGQMVDLEFQSRNHTVQYERLRHCDYPTYPPVNEEIFEWRHLLSSILDAEERFVMFELGAGYGYWSVAAACALRIKKPMLSFALTAVEAEPTHFQWMVRNFINNGLSPEKHRLIQAAVCGNNGGEEIFFVAGNPHEWYGQAIVSHADYRQPDMPESYTLQVPTINLENLLTGIERVDYLDMDIQGAELPAIEAGIAAMTRCVRRAFVATHSPAIEQALPKIFHDFGWDLTCLYPCQTTSVTPLGEIAFDDGVQCWVNPALFS